MTFWKKLHINIFDLLIVLLVLGVLATMLWLRINRKTQWVTLRLIVTNDQWYEGAPPQWWYVDDLSIGQTSKNSFGETVAKIVGLEVFDVGAYRRRAYVDIRLLGTYDKQRQMYLYEYQPLQIGGVLDLTFGKNNVHGLIGYIDNLPGYTHHTIDVHMAAVPPWVAGAYHAGMEMKDSEGNVLAKILSVSIASSTVTDVVNVGQLTQTKIPGSEFEDVTMRLNIVTFHSSGVDYFVDRAAIKVGEQISFQFPQTIIREAEITRIIQ